MEIPKAKPWKTAENRTLKAGSSPSKAGNVPTFEDILDGSSIRCLPIRGARNALADRLKILLDMILSPSWIASLESGGHSAVHWSSVGSPSALDTEIMTWTRENRYIVFTNDLDYGALLFATAATSPSVIQIRAEDVRPDSAEHAVFLALEAAAEDLSTAAVSALKRL